MKKAYIIAGGRSFLGVENRMYRHIPAEILGGRTLEQFVERDRDRIDMKKIDGIIAGNGVGAGGNIARLMMLEAGLSQKIPAVTIDGQCGSGLEAMGMAAARIFSGMGNLYIAGGFESSSTAPRRKYHENHPEFPLMGEDRAFYQVAKFAPGLHRETAMLEGAEQVAVQEGINREMLNPWVIRSHSLARQAREENRLKNVVWEVIPGCNRDEGIRERMGERFLNRLPCVLKNGQVITAGNACLTNDGAAFVAMASKEYCQSMACEPSAEFMDIVTLGGNPEESPRMAVDAVEQLLKKRGMVEEDIDIYECNEAFAVIDELFARRFPSSVDKYNILGGALAYGHPYGASGGIITLHALEALKKVEGTYAVCSIAAAGGLGTAILLKRY